MVVNTKVRDRRRSVGTPKSPLDQDGIQVRMSLTPTTFGFKWLLTYLLSRPSELSNSESPGVDTHRAKKDPAERLCLALQSS